MMKTLVNISCLLSLVMMLLSCSKDEKIDYYNPKGPIAVELDKTTVKKGEPLKLLFSGVADSLIFYSGKEGQNYEHRNRSEIEGLVPTLSFKSYRQYGSQENTLQLFVSRDFNEENYNEQGIDEATWVDITDRFTLSEGVEDTPSGEVDLSEFLTGVEPLFIAFKYTGTWGSVQRKWTIRDLFLNVNLPNGIVQEIGNITNGGWTDVNLKNPTQGWTNDGSQLIMVGGNSSSGSNEDWLISKPFILDDVSSDVGQLIKSRYQTMLKDHLFVFDKVGAYKPVLVAITGAGANHKEEVFEFNIEVTE